MTFFQLLVYSCITFNDMYGMMMQKTCTWAPRDYYAHKERCESDGRAQIGNPIFSDVADDRHVEAMKCVQFSAIL
jgi:hypothetical protein